MTTAAWHERLRRSVSLSLFAGEDVLKKLLILLVLAWLLLGVVLPLIPLVQRSLSDRDGNWVGLANYLRYFNTPALSISFANSLRVSVITTLLAVTLAFGYAYALSRTQMPGKRFFLVAAMLPLYVPPLAHAIGLVYLFGRKGLITTGFGGAFERLVGWQGWDINLYGFNGILLGELLYVFPQAVMILLVAASLADARLYEASLTLQAPPWRTFLTVTLPSMKYGLVSSVFVVFTLVLTDFGVPKVVGGNYNVMATDIYKQVIGQQNFEMGATISVLLLIPTAIAFVIDRLMQRRQAAVLTSRAVPYQPKPNRWADALGFVYCSLVTFAVFSVIATVFLASLVDIWPYKLNLTLRHFDFSKVGGGGYAAFWNSVRMSFYTAVIGTAMTFLSAYALEKLRPFRSIRTLAYFFSMIPVALPGMVIGLAYIFFFNPLEWNLGPLRVSNPFHFMYNTMAILVLSNIVHFYTVSFMTATTALKQLDNEFESVSESLGVPFYRTFWKVTVPLSLPALLEMGMYYFVNAMVTVSAVIFLYSPRLKLASVAIVNMDDAGDTAAAAAMSVLVILTSVGVRLLYDLLTRRLSQQALKWKTR
ncbi:MAG: putative 2-aminoethylphosphonate ABC transporter permease subunit [Anaerolineales bacterium]|nr:putative 2-aminoethylphosphonate ABC transporter permease subunit [Anaerolineales bacterium]MCS7247706.1 putative 2-aminoethylphosphonate ABC transporter permease subunit [Anaerolineales bacterium]MDW8161516.1 putative 2-aminoethylphosphonate ABC transporter permease subunit [Anaerolineales bacterium]MDW8446852.1 putative 2-aminoethylphosphonate ABC transporter permease subunit [Anaerolineales bacterium]